ncbi:MAG TPA: NUDIX domain-containing protein [Candidatus Portnoybacteria bacterium]|jgi:isopentenyldiphosphate isomerase|nr:NUDIX domain-containing protein [Candidatus Portnoybacteria bacterium]MDD5752451.1 NUDIX domain-containing protein [Candidatus Portnoybacteria bacterium]HNU96902.1 NUDIX domain-containing protein [Candidatus Portnoybacteria bacterium]HOZ16659.1 NUDIX domain-containing protein [Candidatus Portnoybacteria bacterium]HPH52360.1 NUDIX domain-containing protein [Candidatus Portnoybacteria bacterium]
MIKKIRAIIYDIKDNVPYFLILHRVLRWDGWEVLKETMEPNESAKQTAIRGIKEETGLEKFKIVKNLKKTEKWEKDGNEYEITATFLIKTDMNQKISLKQTITEHDDYMWATKEEAIEKLTFPETKKIIYDADIQI